MAGDTGPYIQVLKQGLAGNRDSAYPGLKIIHRTCGGGICPGGDCAAALHQRGFPALPGESQSQGRAGHAATYHQNIEAL